MNGTITSPTQTAPPTCLACNYDLRGLGEEPQCPGCGLRNVPESIRRQVWEYVDARAVFFSSPLSPWRKRPAGWWWSLDRDGDVARSARFALFSAVSALFILAMGSALVGSIVFEEHVVCLNQDPNGSTPPREFGRFVEGENIFGHRTSRMEGNPISGKGPQCTLRRHSLARFAPPSLGDVQKIWPAALGLVLMWATPTCLGLWTQVHRRMPKFARARRSIIAAANLESHRMIYAACLLIVSFAVQALLLSQGAHRPWAWIFIHAAVLTAYLCAGWIGALRSDHTRTLIRSNWHLARIIVLYVIILPVFVILGVGTAIEFG